MSSLCDRFTQSFPVQSRQLGAAIPASQLTIVANDDAKLHIQNEGNEVLLEVGDELVYAACSCAWFQRKQEGCKHLWAALQLVDQQKLLSTISDAADLHLIFDPELLDDLFEPPDGSSEWEEDDEEGWYGGPAQAPNLAFRRPKPKKSAAPPKPKPPPPPAWSKTLQEIQGHRTNPLDWREKSWPTQRQVVYVLNLEEAKRRNGLLLEIEVCDPKRNGEMSKPKRASISYAQIATMPDGRDRQILATLAGAVADGYNSWQYSGIATRFLLKGLQAELVLPLIGPTERLFCRVSYYDNNLQPVQVDAGAPWELHLTVAPDEDQHRLTGEFRRGDEKMPITAPQFVCPGFVLANNRLARWDDRGGLAWLEPLRRQQGLVIARADQDRFLHELFQCAELPPLHLPPEMACEIVTPAPQPCLKLKPEGQASGYRLNKTKLEGELTFDYDGLRVAHHDRNQGIFQAKERRLVRRDLTQEQLAKEKLSQLGFKQVSYYYHDYPVFQLAAKHLPKVLKPLLDAAWRVEAEGKLYRQASAFNINVESGIDWFELHGGMKFGDQEVALPDILKAIKSGNHLIQLGDGAFGMLPEDWLKKYGLLAGVGKAEGDHLRFAKSQVGLLDALLSTMPEASFDDVFAQAKNELHHFEGIQPAQPPAEFQGQLRPYQCEGLGWLQFLERFGFGGCLADDMGLGKTVQLLAHLAGRRRATPPSPPSEGGAAGSPRASLVVVPKSLIFNWQQEAARFAPGLRVLDHTGLTRDKTADNFHEYDLILTTYGILRRDALLFKDVEFDLCVLDEAQAVKNAQSESAKAVRLLQARHRLALSGTPIENHLGELWSLFEFLNPGMLGHASVFRMTAGAGRAVEPEVRGLLAKALRPFILRRTKVQVAKDLPDKTEQTLFCDLEPSQRKIYNELRDYYRQSLLGKIAADGIKKSKIQVLTALLRLRQAACHPGLIDKKYADEESAKLDLLMPQLEDVFEEGHKVLVFSQFTSFLALVRQRLDADKVPYEYLDGKTRDRAARVERFQSDPECKLFLISLKAGGLGLNLTAAEYVFLLDPWWNPAVEAQAIDRAHRIGQDKPVFAYRLIARDTVEEKVLELQKSKRELADAILNADNRLLADLSREDLELLLT